MAVHRIKIIPINLVGFNERGPTLDRMRRSIDDEPAVAASPREDDDAAEPMSWAVAISDDYDDAVPRVVVTVEPVGRPGSGAVNHLEPASARRLRTALRDALREIGEDPGL